MLDENAGVIDDLITYYLTDTNYRVRMNSATREKISLDRKQSQGFDVTVTERPELAMIAVQGPNAKAKAAAVFSAEQNAAIEGMKPFSVSKPVLCLLRLRVTQAKRATKLSSQKTKPKPCGKHC